MFFSPNTVVEPRTYRGATCHDNSHAANTAGNIARKGIHRTVIISCAMIVFCVKMTRQNSVVGQHNVNVLKSVARIGFSQTTVEFRSKKFSAKAVRHGAGVLATDKLSCLFQNCKKSGLQRNRQIGISTQIGYCRHFYSLVKIFAVLGSLFPAPPKPKATINGGKVGVNFTIHARCIGCSAVMNHVGREVFLKLEIATQDLSVQSGHRRTGGIKNHDSIFGGCSRTIVGGSEWVPDKSRRNAHGLQVRNMSRDGGGVRRSVAAKVKALSNIEDGHSFGLSDEGAVGVGKSQGFGEDRVGSIFSSDHVGAGSLFIAFGRASKKEESIVIGNARGVDQGGQGLVVVAVKDAPQRTRVDRRIGVPAQQLVVGMVDQ